MKRLLAEVLLLVLLLGSAAYAWDQRQRAEEEVARQDSIRNAWRDTAEAVRERMQGRLTLWRDSTTFYRQQTAELESAVDSLDQRFGASVEDLIATAEAGEQVTVPQLLSLEAVHDTAIRKCQLALNSCRSTVRTVENRLSIFRDTILPTVDSLNRANADLSSELRDLAQPGIVVRIGRNLELVLGTLLVTSGAWCIATC